MRKMKTFGWLLFAAMFAFTSCSKDDSNGDGVLVEDGMYVVGAGTPLAALNDNGKMYNGRNEAKSNALRPGMFEIFMTVKAGVEGFNIVEKAGAIENMYGPATIAPVVLDGTNDQPAETIQLGTFAVNTTKFTVPADGLYHIVVDKTLMTIAIIPVKAWGVIGAATPLGWGGETQLAMKGGFNASTIEFEGTGVKMDKGEFKFRYDNAWKVALSGDTIKVNTNIGGTLAELIPGGANINFEGTARGIYTVSVKWTLAKGIAITLTKSGDIAQTDYTAIDFGIIGNSYNKVDGTLADWNENWSGAGSLPVKVGSVYTWTYNAVDMVLGSFKFRQGSNWDGKSIGFGAVTMAGAAAGNFVDDGGNFKVTVAGKYKFVLVIDAASEAYTLTATIVTK